ncbi:MAG: DUF1499 domain-containing protein [Leptolyngbya sp. BL-A-14]
MVNPLTRRQSMLSDRPSWFMKRFSGLPVFLTVIALTAACWLTTSASASALPLPSAPIVSALLSFPGTRPANLGVANGQFAPCPTTPNCVSSQSQEQEHAIAPFRYTTPPEVAFDKLKTILAAQPRVNILTTTDDYIRTEFTLPIVGFVDDVEFYLDRTANVIQVRSASRLGESDLGVNRKRVETLRKKLGEG